MKVLVVKGFRGLDRSTFELLVEVSVITGGVHGGCTRDHTHGTHGANTALCMLGSTKAPHWDTRPPLSPVETTQTQVSHSQHSMGS